MKQSSIIAALVIAFQLTSIASAQAVSGWTDKQKAKRAELFAQLTPATFANSVTIEDDDLEPIANLSTVKGFAFRGGFTDRIRADNFLRAHIVKTTGKVTYQVYQTIMYSGDARNYGFANFEGDGGVAMARVDTIGHEVDCKYGCVTTDHLVFELSESQLKRIAAGADERPVVPWRFRFKARTGDDWTDDMAPAEAAGLLIAVAKYKQDHKLP